MLNVILLCITVLICAEYHSFQSHYAESRSPECRLFCYAERCNAEYCSAECCDADCHIFKFVLSSILMRVIMLNVTLLCITFFFTEYHSAGRCYAEC